MNMKKYVLLLLCLLGVMPIFGQAPGTGTVDVVTFGNNNSPWIDVSQPPYTAKGVGYVRNDAVMTAGSPTLTSATANFTTTNAVAGMYIRVEGAGTAGADLITTIAARVNSTTLTLSANAATSVATVTGPPIVYSPFVWGYNDTSVVQSIIDSSNLLGYRPTIFFSKPSYILGNITGHREMCFAGASSGSLFANLTSEVGNIGNSQWGTVLIAADTSNPILYFPDAFGTKIERLTFANSANRKGEGLQLGPKTASTFGGISVNMDQVTFLGFNKAIRNRHTNQVTIRGLNILQSVSGVWFGADTSAGGTGFGEVNVLGMQTIGVDYPFNTASGIGMRVTVEAADFNYGIRLARLESLSFFNATTINVEDFAGTVADPLPALVEIYEPSSTVKIDGISFLRTDIPTVSNSTAGTNIRINGDPNSKIVYRTAGREYPDSLARSSVIKRYTSTAWTTLGETEYASLVYRPYNQEFVTREYKDNWTRLLDSTSGSYGVANGIGLMGWQRTQISGTAFQTRDGNATGQAGTLEWHSNGTTTIGTAGRLALGNYTGGIDGSNYFQLEFSFWNQAAAGSKNRYGLYSIASATMNPTDGVGLYFDPASSAYLQLELRTGGTSTLIPTTVLASSLNSPQTAVKVKIQRNSSTGVILTLRNHISGALLGTQVVSAAAVTTANVTPCFLTEITSTGNHTTYLYPNYSLKFLNNF